MVGKIMKNHSTLFFRVPPRPVSTISHELYVLHKNALTSVMTVRAAVRSDMEVVEQLVSTLVKPEPLIAAFRSAVFDDESEHRAFLVLSDQTAVGVAGQSRIKTLIVYI